MKKLFYFLIVLFFTFILISCTNIPNDENNEAIDPPISHEDNDNSAEEDTNEEEDNEEEKEEVEETEFIQYKNLSLSENEIPFSINAGVKWRTSVDHLFEFDIWEVKRNEETPQMIFFYAASYEQLLEEVEKHRDSPILKYARNFDVRWDYIINIYNEKYFEDYILLFYYKFEGNISENYVYSVEVKDNTLTLNVNRFEGMLTAISSWLEVVTLRKEDVANVNEYNVEVRTITKLTSSMTVYINQESMRDVYLKGLTKEDFNGLDNVKSVELWTWSLNVDIIFNEKLTDERLEEILNLLEESENVSSIGYTSNQKIRVSVNNKLFDEVMGKTLTVSDLLGEEIAKNNNYTLEILDFTPIAFVKIEMEKHGKTYYDAMKKQLDELALPFIRK